MDDQALEGLVIHVLQPTTLLRSSSEFASATLLARGDVIELTATDVENSKNRFGESSLSCIDDEDLQILRWGKVVFGIGPWPTGLPVYANAYEDPATWNGKYVIASSVNAEYSGTDNSRGALGVQPRLRNTW